MNKKKQEPPFGVNLPIVFFKPEPVYMAKFRGDRFEKTLKSYMFLKGNAWAYNSRQNWLADMVADAFHFCDVNAIDTDFVIKLARSHFEQEKLDDVSKGLVATPKAAFQRQT
jgi:hypothetical protein